MAEILVIKEFINVVVTVSAIITCFHMRVMEFLCSNQTHSSSSPPISASLSFRRSNSKSVDSPQPAVSISFFDVGLCAFKLQKIFGIRNHSKISSTPFDAHNRTTYLKSHYNVGSRTWEFPSAFWRRRELGTGIPIPTGRRIPPARFPQP